MIDGRPDDLPNFENPPVVETVLSVQFEPLPGVHTAHLGLLWEKFKDRFPRTEERSPLDQAFEQFPEIPRARLSLQLQTYENPPVPRIWFINNPGNELIQVQADRFIRNWRKEGEGEQYPRFERVKTSFEADFGRFHQFLQENGLSVPRVNQCEVTYVNHIPVGDGFESLRDAEKVFSFWKLPSTGIPGAAEDLRLHARFVMPDLEGNPIGRLHVNLQPAVRTTDNKPMYVFHLTARGQVGDQWAFFDVGRSWIVKSFAALTTSHMHLIWKRTDSLGNR